MTGERVEVRGLKELTRTLRREDAELVKEIKKINRAAAEQVAPVARGIAPHRSGRLAASVRVGATQRSGTVKVGRSSVPYAGPIHFGWPRHSISPQPFLWDALDSRRDEIARLYAERVTTLVESVWKGGG